MEDYRRRVVSKSIDRRMSVTWRLNNITIIGVILKTKTLSPLSRARVPWGYKNILYWIPFFAHFVSKTTTVHLLFVNFSLTWVWQNWVTRECIYNFSWKCECEIKMQWWKQVNSYVSLIPSLIQITISIFRANCGQFTTKPHEHMPIYIANINYRSLSELITISKYLHFRSSELKMPSYIIDIWSLWSRGIIMCLS